MIMTKKKIFAGIFCAFLLAVACLIQAFFVEPNSLSVTRKQIRFDGWAGTQNRVRVAVAGDFHFAPNDDARAEKIVEAILAENPDAVFLLGDYANGHKRESSMSPRAIAKHLGRLAEKIPVFAVLGNHDAYVGRREIADALREHGIVVFEEKGGRVLSLKNGSRIFVGGTLDAHSYFPVFDRDDIPENPHAGTMPFVLLSHSPDVLPFLDAGIDLTLCGHTHGGQICLPGGLPIFNSCRVAENQFSSGMQTVPASGKPIFITRGLGTSVLPLRFFCLPEIAVLELLPAKQPRNTSSSE